MREIQIIPWCDNPVHPPRTVRATTEETVTLNRGKPHLIDLCDDCDTNVIDPLKALLAVAAIVPDTTPRGTVGGQLLVDSHCEFPGCDKGPHGTPFVAKSRTGLGRHMAAAHGTSMRKFEAER